MEFLRQSKRIKAVPPESARTYVQIISRVSVHPQTKVSVHSTCPVP